MLSKVFLTEPDMERLSILSSYLRSRQESQHLLAFEKKISNARICDPTEIPADVITMNSRALVRHLDTDQQAVYTLVFPSSADAPARRISVLGGLGRALLGTKVGEVIEYSNGVSGHRCQVLEVLYQPEAAGDDHG